LLVIAMLGTASASPLGVVWKQNVKCPIYNSIHATTDAFGWIDNRTLVLRTRATGAPLPGIKLRTSNPRLVALTDELVVTIDTHDLEAYDLKARKRMWRKHLDNATSSSAAFEGSQIAYLMKSSLELVDAKTGARAWSAKLEASADALLRSVPPMSHSLVYLVERNVITAYSRVDGRRVWRIAPGADVDDLIEGATVVGDDIVVSTDHALTWIDSNGATSALALDRGDIDAVVGDRVYVSSNNPFLLTAIDRRSHKPAWTRPLKTLERVEKATAASVYVAQGDDQIRELDPKTGKVVAAFGVGVAQVIGRDGTPGLIACGRNTMTAFDPSAPDVPLETAEISGTVKCTNCQADQQMWVQVGDVKTKVGPKGAFTLTVTSRGSHEVIVRFVEGERELFISDFTYVQTLELDGSKQYRLGKLAVEQQQEGD
jgi:outer membrane protein assembly factor BamB